MTVERPAEGEEIQGLAALLLGRGANRVAGLQDAPLRVALWEKHATHQPPQGLKAGEIHQNLGEGEKKNPVQPQQGSFVYQCVQFKNDYIYLHTHTVINTGYEVFTLYCRRRAAASF